MDDRELLELFHCLQRGNRDAFEKLYRHTWRNLFDLAVTKTKDKEEAEDIVQEIFTRLWDKRENIQIHTNVGAYLYRMAKHEIIRRIQTSIAVNRKEEIYQRAIEELSITLEDSLLAKELQARWKKEIAKLPDKQREIYIRHYELGHSIAEIAVELGIAEQTVKNQLGSAKKRIRSVMELGLLVYLLTVI